MDDIVVKMTSDFGVVVGHVLEDMQHSLRRTHG